MLIEFGGHIWVLGVQSEITSSLECTVLYHQQWHFVQLYLGIVTWKRRS